MYAVYTSWPACRVVPVVVMGRVDAFADILCRKDGIRLKLEHLFNE